MTQTLLGTALDILPFKAHQNRSNCLMVVQYLLGDLDLKFNTKINGVHVYEAAWELMAGADTGLAAELERDAIRLLARDRKSFDMFLTGICTAVF